jgi:hypothetical protein
MRLIASMFGSAAATNALLRAQIGNGFNGWNDIYDLLEAYYYNNDLYTTLGLHALEDQQANRKTLGLRTVAHRIVEFYASKTFPFSLEDGVPIRADYPAIIDPIERMWEWSNFETQQPTVGRFHSLYGDAYLQVATKGAVPRNRQVYWTQLHPRNVRIIKTDFRGYTTYVRIDTPTDAMEDDGTERTYMVTDVWDKYAGTFRRWEHDKGYDTPLAELGPPAFQRSLDAFRIDFIPVVKIPFRDIGLPRGMSAFLHILDKQNEANRIITSLHLNLFRWNRPFWVATANEEGADALDLIDEEDTETDSSNKRLDLGGEEAISLPGRKRLEPLVPDIDWSGHLGAAALLMEEIEYDAPELAYSKLRTMNQVSARAVALLLSDTIDRATEARRNAWGGLVRVQQMGLTMGQVGGVPGFDAATIGTWEQGRFRHRMVGPAVISATEQEEADTLATRAGAGVQIGSITQRGILTEVLDFTEDEADRILAAAPTAGGTVAAIGQAAAEGNPTAIAALAESTTETAGGADDVPAAAD